MCWRTLTVITPRTIFPKPSADQASNFIQRALDTRQVPASLQHLEYVYGTLAAWGMHRMSSGGSKMCAFGDFRASVEQLKEKIIQAQGFMPGLDRERNNLPNFQKEGHRRRSHHEL
jgi:hypothetical protein